MKRLVLIDAHAIIHRAYHALPRLTAPDGKLVNAVYGFSSILLKALKELKPDYAAAAFDLPAPTFRHAAFEPYKATRVKAPDELYQQIPLVREVLEALSIRVFEKEGFEADDLIGTIARKAEAADKHLEVVIVTGDLDTLQLVDTQTKVFTMKKGVSETVLYDAAAVGGRYGLKPEALADLKGLCGDPSDNIPGVKGIGQKTAAALLQKFGSIEEIYARLKKNQTAGISPAVVKKLETQEESARLSKTLATIKLDLPIELSLNDLILPPVEANVRVREIFSRLGFESLLRRMANAAPPQSAGLKSQTGPSLLGPKVRVQNNVPRVDPTVPAALMLSRDQKQCFFAQSAREVIIFPSALLSKTGAAEKIGAADHLFVFDSKALFKKGFGPPLNKLSDVLLFWYLLQPDRRRFLVEELMQKELRLPQLPDEAAAAAGLLEIGPHLQTRVRSEEFWEVYETLDLPLAPILGRMEHVGIGFDPQPLDALSKEMAESLIRLEEKIYELSGMKFNINSPRELREVLFEKLKLPSRGIRKTEKGADQSTSASELLKLAALHPVIAPLLEYREQSKLKSTYVDVLPKLAGADGRIHTTWNQAGTATGRLASSDPNLQNIPIRSSFGKRIRSAFVAGPGFSLVAFDYSQLELRIAASLSRDEKMIETFQKGVDIHCQTAAEVSNISVEEVTPELRAKAKALNFGILYGMGPRSFAESAGISREEAEFFMEEYFNDFQGLGRFIEETKAAARGQGFTKTAFGRKRSFSEIASTNFARRREAERQAVNHPIQGTAADLMRKAMISVWGMIQARGWGDTVRLLLQVHDELVFEIRAPLEKEVETEIKAIMERVWPQEVPLVVESKIGQNWAEL